jgi:hypothetical protein
MRSSNFQCTSATDKLHFPLYKIQLFNTFLLQILRSPLDFFSKDKMTTISWKIWLALIFVMIFRILLEPRKTEGPWLLFITPQFTEKHIFKINIYFFSTSKRSANYVISFEVYDDFIGQKILKLWMKAGKLAIWPWLSCPYKKHMLVDLPSSVPIMQNSRWPLLKLFSRRTTSTNHPKIPHLFVPKVNQDSVCDFHTSFCSPFSLHFKCFVCWIHRWMPANQIQTQLAVILTD